LEFVDVSVGEHGGSLWVFVVDGDADDAVFADFYGCGSVECFAGGFGCFCFVDDLEFEAFDHVVLYGAAFEHGDVGVVGVFDACCAGHSSEGSELTEHC